MNIGSPVEYTCDVTLLIAILKIYLVYGEIRNKRIIYTWRTFSSSIYFHRNMDSHWNEIAIVLCSEIFGPMIEGKWTECQSPIVQFVINIKRMPSFINI